MARLRASAWVPIALRVGAVVIALVVLAWIGRTAAARPTSPSSIAAADGDAAVSPAGEGTSDAATSSISAPPPGSPVAAVQPPIAPPATGATRAHASPTDPVFINHASVEELRRLPGVGPKRAEAILVLRQRVGRFQRVEDLLRVKGVGRGAVKKWRPLVRLDTPVSDNAADGGLR